MTLETRKPTGAVPWPLILVEGGEKSGKAQPYHSKIATPDGWTTMGQIVPGDRVIGSNGEPTTVMQVHERGLQPIYRLAFSDGATVEACGEHLWATWTASERHRTTKAGEPRNLPPQIRTTEAIREMVLSGTVIHIPMTEPVQYDSALDLPLHPYVLGLLLGDGCLTKPSYPMFTPGDEPLFDALEEHLPEGDTLTRLRDTRTAGIKGGNTTCILRGFGLMGVGSPEKFIPSAYLLASADDRLALLQGLMDTDGGMEGRKATFCTTSERMAGDMQSLVESLGGTASTRVKASSYKLPDGSRRECLPAFVLTVRLPSGMCPFRLERKADAWQQVRPIFNCPPRRTVRQVDYLGEMPARCITVAAEDHLYLTDHFVVTHNSWSCAILSTSDKVGPTYWLDLGEGSGDEYGAIPGTRYEIVLHDGTFASIYSAVQEIHALAQKAQDAGDKPVVLVIDSMTAEWEWLKDWATDRARGSKSNKAKLQRDPHAEIVVSSNYWNDANTRHRKLMKLLMTFPGIAVITARGKEVAVIGDNGQPVEGKKDYRVEGHKTLAFDASCWVRVSRDEPAVVIGARSVHAGIRPGHDDPQTLAENWTLEWLVFDVLKCDPAKAHTRDLVEPKRERTPEQIRDEAVKQTTGFERLGELFTEAKNLGYESVIVPNERDQEELLPAMIRRLGVARKDTAPADQQQRRQLQALWRQAGDFENAEDRARFVAEILGRDVDPNSGLTSGEAHKVIVRLQAYVEQNTPPGEPSEPAPPEMAGVPS